MAGGKKFLLVPEISQWRPIPTYVSRILKEKSRFFYGFSSGFPEKRLGPGRSIKKTTGFWLLITLPKKAFEDFFEVHFFETETQKIKPFNLLVWTSKTPIHNREICAKYGHSKQQETEASGCGSFPKLFWIMTACEMNNPLIYYLGDSSALIRWMWTSLDREVLEETGVKTRTFRDESGITEVLAFPRAAKPNLIWLGTPGCPLHFAGRAKVKKLETSRECILCELHKNFAPKLGGSCWADNKTPNVKGQSALGSFGREKSKDRNQSLPSKEGASCQLVRKGDLFPIPESRTKSGYFITSGIPCRNGTQPVTPLVHQSRKTISENG